MQWTQRAARRIGGAARLFNGATRLALCAVTLALAAGCTQDPPPMQPADAAAAPAPRDAEVDAAPTVEVPIAPLDLLRRMPRPPEPLAAVPGDLAAGLTRARPALRPSEYTDRVLVERPTDGAFDLVHYALTPDGQHVRAVLATFVDGYADPARREALTEAIRIRLGPGEPLPPGPYTGTRWTTLPFRVDLRHDTATGDLELLYHRHGRVDPTAAPPDP